MKQLEYFFAALRFFTRLPVPAWVGHDAQQLNHAARWFPLVGAIVGAIGAAATELAALALPIGSAVLLGMVATVLVTGGFHEDGFADSCDGFGGGWDKAQVLAIMKDSRLGSYGAIGIVLLLLAKWNALVELDTAAGPPFLAVALVAAHAASRLASTTLIHALDYVRDDDSAKSKPLASRMTLPELAIATACGLAPCLLLPPLAALWALGAAAIVTWLAARYFVRRIGGYTGDALGATQQASELAFYIGLLCSFS
jgi:adenosylcobinamide-GDP ribazoletransferase